MTPLEEARGYQTLLEKYELTQEEVAKTVGKSRPAVTNAMRLLGLPQEIQDMVERGELSAGHGRALLAFADEELMVAVARKAAAEGLSVRQLEKLAKKAAQESSGKETPVVSRCTYFDEVELSLHEHLGRKVRVAGNGKKGVLQIEFYGEEDLQRLMASIEFKEPDEI